MDRVDPKVDEAIETLNMKDGPTRRKLLKGTGLVSATAAASALLAACRLVEQRRERRHEGHCGELPEDARRGSSGSSTTSPRTPSSCPPSTASPTPPRCSTCPTPKWTGSTNSVASQMVAQINAAVSAKAAGIATTLINSSSFTTPVANAMSAGIPVLSYNADGVVSKSGVPDIGTNRLAYVGQALFTSGQQLGRADQVADDAGRGGDLHRDSRDGEHPAPLRRRRLDTHARWATRWPRSRRPRSRPRSWRTRRRTCSRTRASRARSPWTRPRPRSWRRRSPRPACRACPTAASTPSRRR